MWRFLTCMFVVVLLGLVPGVSDAAPTGKILTCRSDDRLTIATGQVGDGDSVNWLDAREQVMSVSFCYSIAPTATVNVFLSLDEGVSWDDVENTQYAATECFTIDNPTGFYKTVVSLSSGSPVVHVTYRCGPKSGR
jgi:hypothetical protein